MAVCESNMFKKIIFKKMLHRTIDYVIEHKKTRKILTDSFVEALKDPRVRKLFKEVAEKAVIEYAKSTGYKI